MPTPTRPGARRPSASSPSMEDAPVLSAVDPEGEDISIDPSLYSQGMLNDEVVTVAAAQYRFVDFKKNDGTYAVDKDGNRFPAIIQLRVTFNRSGGEDNRPHTEEYKMGPADRYSVSEDGNKIRSRKTTDGRKRPFYMFSAGPLFLKSLADAGGKDIVKRVDSEGASALVGLRLAVRRQKVAGMSENAKEVLLVDQIFGLDGSATGSSTSASASTAKSTKSTSAAPASAPAPKAQAAAATAEDASASNIIRVAETALLDILAENGNTINRSQIAVKVANSEKYADHAQRGLILRTLRTEDFLMREDAPWTVSKDGDISV